ncbi:hypothetical protein A2U01_0069958, partial [Trifolium medium]|nr:hypothetical protein [Trifolium medium]
MLCGIGLLRYLVPLYLVDPYCTGVVCFGDGLQAETYLP